MSGVTFWDGYWLGLGATAGFLSVIGPFALAAAILEGVFGD